MQYILAADGGGTKTHVVCADETGKQLGEGFSGPTNLTATSVGSASFNLQEAVRQAVQNLPPDWKVAHMLMGVAGLDSPQEAETAQTVFSQALHYFPINGMALVNDIIIALASGTDAPNAVALIAGTGSNCYGHNDRGAEAKVGGMDYLLSDEGSGYSIGRSVLRACVRSFDGRGPKTLLEKMVCDRYHIQSVTELKNAVYNPPLNKMEIADLTKECVLAAEQHDPVAQHIFDVTIENLYTMVVTVAQKLQIVDNAWDCVFVGGVTKIPRIHDQLMKRLTEFSPKLAVKIPEKPPVFGAVKLALKQLA